MYPRPDAQDAQENPLQLAQRKFAPIKRFTLEQAEELLARLCTSEIRARIIERAVEDISLANDDFANRMRQHSSGRRVTDVLLNAIAWPLILQHYEHGHALNATKKAVFTTMTERISAELQAFTSEDERKKRDAGGEVLVEPPPGCSTWRTSAYEGGNRVGVVPRCPDSNLPVGPVMVENVALGQRVMIKKLLQHPELNGQLGTVVKAVDATCTEAESARVTVGYTCAALTKVPAPTAGVDGAEQISTIASTIAKQVSVKPRNLAIAMKAEVGGIVVCYGTSGTLLGESAAARESRAHTTTESRRHLTDLFNDTEEDLIERPQGAPGEKDA